jgi:PAS domain S-box-containing protein
MNLLLAAREPEIICKIHEGLAQSSLGITRIIDVNNLNELIKYPNKSEIDLLLIDEELALPDLEKSFLTIKKIFTDLPLVVLVDIEDFDTARWAATHDAHSFAIKSDLMGGILECVILQAIDRMKTRTQLQESTRQVKNLMDNLPGIAYRCKNDEQWTVEFISAGCQLLTGYAVEDLQGNNKLSFSDLIHPDDRQMVRDKVQNAIEKGQKYHLEYRILTADNQEKWVWEQGSLVSGISGIRTLEGFISDISDRRQREFNLQSMIEIGDIVRGSLTQAEMGDKLLKKVSTQYGVSCSAIAKISNHNDLCTLEYVNGLWEGLRYTEISIKNCRCQNAIINNEPVVIDSQIAHPGNCKPLQNDKSRFTAFIPLITDEETNGLLIIGRNVQFSINDIQAFTAIGDLISSALERHNLIQRLEKQLEKMESLHTIDQAITGVFDIIVINRVILEEVRKRLGASGASILHLNPMTNTLDLSGDVGLRRPFIRTVKVPISTSFAGKVLMDRSMFQAPDLANNPVEFSVREWQDEGYKAYFAHPLIVKGKPIGVMELFFSHTFYPDHEWLKFFESLATQAAVAYDLCHTFSDLQKVKQNLANNYNAALETWSKSLELTNIESQGHIQRVTRQTLKLAKDFGVDESEWPNIERGALLHDIGKLGILDEILLKKGKLTDTEWHEIEKHPKIARDLLSGVNLLKDAVEIPFSHHENWDGSGYPQGLKGESIPLAARIFAVVETYDALLSDKPYRKAWTKEKAVEYLNEEKGKKFDPKIIDTFLSTLI